MKPSEIDDCVLRHDARNLQLKRRLAERGVDLRGEHEITWHFRAPSQAQAVLLRQELCRRGFSVVELRPGSQAAPGWWHVDLHTQCSLEEAASHEFAEIMVRCAAARSCIYDGWGTSI